MRQFSQRRLMDGLTFMEEVDERGSRAAQDE
jgi:hypothetical protein